MPEDFPSQPEDEDRSRLGQHRLTVSVRSFARFLLPTDAMRFSRLACRLALPTVFAEAGRGELASQSGP